MAKPQTFDIVALDSDEYARIGLDGAVRSSNSKRAEQLWVRRPRTVRYAFCRPEVINGSFAYARHTASATFEDNPDDYLAAFDFRHLFKHGFTIQYQ